MRTIRFIWVGLAAALAIVAQVNAGEIVVVMAPGAAALSKDQVANIYLGRNNEFKPLDLFGT